MTNILALEVFIFLVLSACGCQPQNNWTVHVWRRQWCQFEYLIRCGASCLLMKSRQGFIGLFFLFVLHHGGNSAQVRANVKNIIGSFWILIGIQFLNQFSKLCCRVIKLYPTYPNQILQHLGMLQWHVKKSSDTDVVAAMSEVFQETYVSPY